MKNKPILIVVGEPNSIFLEILFKTLINYKFQSPIILICSKQILRSQMKYFKYEFKINVLDINKIETYNLNNKSLNIIDVKYDQKKVFENISIKSNQYLEKSFSIATELIKSNLTNKFLNGPISKKHFLKNRFLGITEYLANKFKVSNTAMLIYNKNLSVSPITTHLPIKNVSKKITKKLIINKIKLIDSFFKNNFNIKPSIAVTGLNPHCEGKTDEEKKMIKPAIEHLSKKNVRICGPVSADTIFIKDNRKKFNVIVGMYHDQVLTPLKSLFEYDAINVTLGLPFIRVSPDHGPNEIMIGQNKSNPLSVIKALKFLDTSD